MSWIWMIGAFRPPMNAYTRWAQLVVNTVCCPSDPRTLTSWSDYFGISEGTLRARCRAAGVAAIAARDFSRLLRVVVRSQRNDPRWDPAAYLEAGDPRTIRRLLVGGGLADWPDGAAAASRPGAPSPTPTRRRWPICC